MPTLFLVQPDGEIRLSSVGFERQDLESVAREFGQALGRPIAVFRSDDRVPDSKPG